MHESVRRWVGRLERHESSPVQLRRAPVRGRLVGKAQLLLHFLGRLLFLIRLFLSRHRVLVVSITVSGLSLVVLQHPGDPCEPDRQSLAFGRRESAQQLGVLGVQFLTDPLGRCLPVVGELESVEASVVLVPLS